MTSPAWLAFSALTAALCCAPSARADGTKQACVNASTEGQALRDANKLREARDRFVTCARDECPAIVRKYCAEWLADSERRMSTVIFRVLSAEGADVAGAQITIDGAPQTRPPGTALPLDPGEHAVHVERPVGPPLDAQVVVVEGEKGRVVPLHFAPTAPAHGQETETALPLAPSGGTKLTPLTLVAAGVGVVGLAGFTYFGLKAHGDLSHLRQTCAPFCAPSDLSTVKHEALAADVSLGVGVVALGVAAYSFFAHHDAPPKDETTVSVSPVPGGAMARVGLRF